MQCWAKAINSGAPGKVGPMTSRNATEATVALVHVAQLPDNRHMMRAEATVQMKTTRGVFKVLVVLLHHSAATHVDVVMI